MNDSTRKRCEEEIARIQDHRKREKIKSLYEEQLHDEEHGRRVNPHHIDFTKRNYQRIVNPMHRAVMVLLFSRAFEIREVAAVLNVHPDTVTRIKTNHEEAE